MVAAAVVDCSSPAAPKSASRAMGRSTRAAAAVPPAAQTSAAREEVRAATWCSKLPRSSSRAAPLWCRRRVVEGAAPVAQRRAECPGPMAASGTRQPLVVPARLAHRVAVAAPRTSLLSPVATRRVAGSAVAVAVGPPARCSAAPRPARWPRRTAQPSAATAKTSCSAPAGSPSLTPRRRTKPLPAQPTQGRHCAPPRAARAAQGQLVPATRSAAERGKMRRSSSNVLSPMTPVTVPKQVFTG